MATPSTRSVLWALALAGILPSCTDDPVDPGPGDVVAPAPKPITWRVPCGATVFRDGELEETHRYTYDADKRLTGKEVRDRLDRVSHVITQGFTDDGRLAWIDSVDGIPGFIYDGWRSEHTYDDGGFLTRVTVTDRVFGDNNGGDSSSILTHAYDRTGARISSDFHYVTPGPPNWRSTITGDRTERMTEVSLGDEGGHATQTWEQPDRDPDHWTITTSDYDSDGVLDVRSDRTLDAQGLPLTQIDLDFRDDPAGIVVGRVVTEREPDGTPLTIVEEDRLSDGTLVSTYRTEHHFTCE